MTTVDDDGLRELEAIHGTDGYPPAGEMWAEWHVTCGLCACQDSVTADTAAQARAAFRRRGWVCSRADGWTCPRSNGKGPPAGRSAPAPAAGKGGEG
jgi:hypothetical protein